MGATFMMPTEAQKLIEQKLQLLQRYMKELEKYVLLETDMIVGDIEKLRSMERSFQLMVDEAIDINSVLAYQLGNTVPDAYKSTFYDLVPIKIFDLPFVERIAESARVRNQIMHDYEKLTASQTVEAIKKFFELYQTYAKIIIEKFVMTSGS